MDVEIKYTLGVDGTELPTPYPALVPNVAECNVGEPLEMVLTRAAPGPEEDVEVRIPWSQIRDVMLVYVDAGQVTRVSPFA